MKRSYLSLAWFLSATVRHAAEMRRQVVRLINEQRDILEPQAIANLWEGVRVFDAALSASGEKPALVKAMEALEKVANDNLRPHPHGAAREQVRDILVAIVTILSFTTFFLQLTKIPTGSMQPTLYGITQEDLRGRPEVQIPGFLGRCADYWVRGFSYFQLVAPVDGEIERIEPPKMVFPFVRKQTVVFQGQRLTVWLPPEGGLEGRHSLGVGDRFAKGEDIVRLKVIAGDHLLVDRFSYNFCRPERGDIIVFKTKGIPALPEDVLYIKRLVALPNEKVTIGNDRHLVIDGRRLDAATRHFEQVYSFDFNPLGNLYVGHVNGEVGSETYHRPGLAPKFPDEKTGFQVGPGRYLAMGDNTLNSSDGRAWGDLPQKNVIGRCWFVYWPFTDRFGWGYR